MSTAHVRIASPGTPKLLPKYIGPFKVQVRQGPLSYKLELPEHYRIHPVFHVSLLKAYKASPHRKPPPPPDIIGDEEEFEVEDILQHRQKGRKTSYLVKWTGYGQKYNSLEPEECFAHAHDTIKAYWARRSSRHTQGCMSLRGAQGSAACLGIKPAARLSNSLRHMLGDKGSYSNMLGLMAAAPRHVRIAVKDEAKVKYG